MYKGVTMFQTKYLLGGRTVWNPSPFTPIQGQNWVGVGRVQQFKCDDPNSYVSHSERLHVRRWEVNRTWISVKLSFFHSSHNHLFNLCVWLVQHYEHLYRKTESVAFI